MQALQTVGRGSTASSKNVSWAMDIRPWPMTSKSMSRSQQKTFTSSGKKSGTIEVSGTKTSEEKTGKGAAENAKKQSSRKAQARDACGRFVKTMGKETKVMLELDKLRNKQSKLKIKIEELEKTVDVEVTTRNKVQKEFEMKMLKKVARDFMWLTKMVLKIKMKIESGSRSQRMWGNKELPKYEARMRIAQDAQVKLNAEVAKAGAKEAEEAEDDVCMEKEVAPKEGSPKSQVGTVSGLQARLQRAKIDMKAREEEKDELYEELGYWKDRAGHWQAQCDEWKSQVKLLESRTQVAETERQELEEEAEELARKMGKLKQKLKEHREIADENDAAMMMCMQENDELKEALRRAQRASWNGSSSRGRRK